MRLKQYNKKCKIITIMTKNNRTESFKRRDCQTDEIKEQFYQRITTDKLIELPFKKSSLLSKI